MYEEHPGTIWERYLYLASVATNDLEFEHYSKYAFFYADAAGQLDKYYNLLKGDSSPTALKDNYGSQ